MAHHPHIFIQPVNATIEMAKTQYYDIYFLPNLLYYNIVIIQLEYYSEYSRVSISSFRLFFTLIFISIFALLHFYYFITNSNYSEVVFQSQIIKFSHGGLLLPRKRRELSTTGIYHVVIKGTNSQLLFEERKDYIKYLDIIEYQKSKCDFKLFAYCLMNNHVHLLIQTTTTPLSSIFEKINTTYSCWFNMKYQRSGPLLNGRYHSEPVNDYSYLLATLRYIHCNPVKAGLENHPGENHFWSSYLSYTHSLQDFVDTSFVLEQMGGLEDFIKFHETQNSDDCLDIHKIRARIPDDVAMSIIKEICKVEATTSVSEIPSVERNRLVRLCKKRGVSARQLNRLTGIPRGIIDRILANKL